MTTILLARHGETDWNAEHRWQGQLDRDLNETGVAQAQALAEELAGQPIDVVYASDLTRARHTAEIVAVRLGLEVETEPRLREVDVGDWSGRLSTEIQESDPGAYALWEAGAKGWNGGESYEEMGERVVAAVTELARRHAGGTVLVVAHGGSIRACRASASGLSFQESRASPLVPGVANCEVVELRLADGRLTTPFEPAPFEPALFDPKPIG